MIVQNYKVMCIPRMDTNITSDFIKCVVNRYRLGKITKLIEIPHKENKYYKRVIIHIMLDETSHTTEVINSRFSNNQDIKLIYDEPWYWKIVEANYNLNSSLKK